MRNSTGSFARLAQPLGILPTLLTTATVLFSLSVPTAAQEARPATVQSVEESFSVLHQALSATAGDLLASAQRPPGVERPAPNATPGSRGERQTARSAVVPPAAERVQALRSVFEPILREEGIPQQLTAVVLVESGGRATALSPKGARGLWQLMPDTARRYGMVVTASLDDRLDPYKSTRAAARYLRDLYVQFGTWPLALAAYNAGEDAVRRAVERVSSRDFGSIAGRLPIETQNYVPAVLNAMEVLKSELDRYLATSAENLATNSAVFAVAKLEN